MPINSTRKLALVGIVSILVIGVGIVVTSRFPASQLSPTESLVLIPSASPNVESSPIPPNPEQPIIGRLSIASAGIFDLPIVIGTDTKTLDTGMAGAYDWSGPGENGVFAVTAHRVGAGGPFLNLDKIAIGESIYVISAKGQNFEYQVTSVKVVKPSATEVLKGPKNESRIVLITCTPISTYSDRLVVTGELVN